MKRPLLNHVVSALVDTDTLVELHDHTERIGVPISSFVRSLIKKALEERYDPTAR